MQRYAPRITELTVAGVACVQVTPTTGSQEHTVLYLYGGGCVTGTSMQDMPIMAALASHANVRVVTPQYRLAPENPWPAGLNDAYAVYCQLSRTCAPAGLAVVGESAGGNLALSLVQRALQQKVGLPDCLALLSPWCDLSLDHDYGNEDESFDPSLSVAHLHAAAQLYVGSHPYHHPEISPLFGQYGPAFPATLITTGTRDRLSFDCERLAAKMFASGASVGLHAWKGLWHVFEFYDEAPEAAQSLQAIARFLRQKMTK